MRDVNPTLQVNAMYQCTRVPALIRAIRISCYPLNKHDLSLLKIDRLGWSDRESRSAGKKERDSERH